MTTPVHYINAYIDKTSGEVDIPVILQDNEALINANDVNAIDVNTGIYPVTGTKKEYRHFIQDTATKVIWDPTMLAEVVGLLDTKTAKFI